MKARGKSDNTGAKIETDRSPHGTYPRHEAGECGAGSGRPESNPEPGAEGGDQVRMTKAMPGCRAPIPSKGKQKFGASILYETVYQFGNSCKTKTMATTTP